MIAFDDLLDVGKLLNQSNLHARALPFLREAYDQYADQRAFLLHTLTDAEMATKNNARALVLANEYLAQFPGDPEMLNRKSVAHMNMQEMDAALECLLAAEQNSRYDPATCTGLAYLYQTIGRHKEALAPYQRALEANPTLLNVRMWMGMLQLLLAETPEQFAEGYNNYDARIAFANPCIPNGIPIWRGESEGTEGKTLAIFTEQGIGDNIMCLRWLLDDTLAGDPWKFGKILLITDKRMVELVLCQDSPAHLVVVEAQSGPLPRYDFQCPMMTLPGIMHRAGRPTWIKPYLKAPSGQFSDIFPNSLEKIIGICHQGNPTHSNDQYRSIPGPLFAKMIAPYKDDFSFVLLQEAALCPELEALGVVQYATPDLASFSELVDSCDLVITVDTATAHLAGALGKETLMMVSVNPDWRWGLTEKQRWYGSNFFIPRQEYFNNWEHETTLLSLTMADFTIK